MSHQSRDSIVSLMETISRTRRPRLLLRAARIGTLEYRRETDLRRVLRLPAAPAPGAATVRALIELEASLESLRTRPNHTVGDPGRAARHVEVMIALMSEARLMAEAVEPSTLPPRRLSLAPER